MGRGRCLRRCRGRGRVAGVAYVDQSPRPAFTSERVGRVSMSLPPLITQKTSGPVAGDSGGARLRCCRVQARGSTRSRATRQLSRRGRRVNGEADPTCRTYAVSRRRCSPMPRLFPGGEQPRHTGTTPARDNGGMPRAGRVVMFADEDCGFCMARAEVPRLGVDVDVRTLQGDLRLYRLMPIARSSRCRRSAQTGRSTMATALGHGHPAHRALAAGPGNGHDPRTQRACRPHCLSLGQGTARACPAAPRVRATSDPERPPTPPVGGNRRGQLRAEPAIGSRSTGEVARWRGGRPRGGTGRRSDGQAVRRSGNPPHPHRPDAEVAIDTSPQCRGDRRSRSTGVHGRSRACCLASRSASVLGHIEMRLCEKMCR